MPRSLVTAPVLALLLINPAVAQDAAPATSTELEQVGLTPPTVLSQGFSVSGQDVLVTGLLGETVYSSIQDSAEEIGSIIDMVITPGIGISAVVISVGGFLGAGEKEVAIDFAQLEWATRQDGSRRWVLATSAEALLKAPAFIWSDSEAVTGESALTRQEEQDQMVNGDANDTAADPRLTTDETERPATTTTSVDRTGFSEFDETGLTVEDLIGIGVYGINDEQIGTIGDVIINTDGSFDAVIVDVGGFLGLGAKPVAVGYDDLVFSADTFGNRYLFLNTTREQLEAQPTYDPATYARERNSQRMVISP